MTRAFSHRKDYLGDKEITDLLNFSPNNSVNAGDKGVIKKSNEVNVKLGTEEVMISDLCLSRGAHTSMEVDYFSNDLQLDKTKVSVRKHSLLCESDILFLTKVREEFASGHYSGDEIISSKLAVIVQKENVYPWEIVRLRNLISMKEFRGDLKEDFAMALHRKKISKSVRIRCKKNLVCNRKYDNLVLKYRYPITPRKRRQLMQKHQIRTPSPNKSSRKFKKEEMKALSLIIHLYSFQRYGSMDVLLNKCLTSHDFIDIQTFAGSSGWNLFKGRSIRQFERMWRNAGMCSEPYMGHKITGYENSSHLHEANKIYCPFGHCESLAQLGSSSPFKSVTDPSPSILGTKSRMGKVSNVSRVLFPHEDSNLPVTAPSPSINSLVPSISSRESTTAVNLNDYDPAPTLQRLVAGDAEKCQGTVLAGHESIIDQIIEQIIANNVLDVSNKSCSENFSDVNEGAYARGSEKKSSTELDQMGIDECVELAFEDPTMMNTTQYQETILDDHESMITLIIEQMITDVCNGVEISSCSESSSKILSTNTNKASLSGSGQQKCRSKGLRRVSKKKQKYLEKQIGRHGLHNDNDSACTIKCPIEGCDRSFSSVFGCEKHVRIEHKDEKKECLAFKPLVVCPICGKRTRYVDQHIRNMHRSLGKKCPVCLATFYGDFTHHRGLCFACRYHNCTYKNKKLDRLLDHIANKCPFRVSGVTKKEVNLSPDKVQMPASSSDDTNDTVSQNQSVENALFESISVVHNDDQPASDTTNNKASEQCDRELGRSKFLGDDIDEVYVSEEEDGDEKEYTKKRREIKNCLEKELREVDGLTSETVEGAIKFEKLFLDYMRMPYQGEMKKNTKYSKLNEPSTPQVYLRMYKKYIAPAFNRLVEPFNPMWLIDLETPKHVTYCGIKRKFVDECEPIYFTSAIAEDIFQQLDNIPGEGGSERNLVLCSVMSVLDFLEYKFNKMAGAYGHEPLRRLLPYHTGVRAFLKAGNCWKKSHDDSDRIQSNTKTIKDHKNPGQDAEVAKRYKGYLKSQPRKNSVAKTIYYSEKSAPVPSADVITEIGNFVMGEIVGSTGKRAVVIRRLPVGSYALKTAGWKPDEVDKDDQEKVDNLKIFSKNNPCLPPKRKACIHQLASGSPICEVECEDRAIPDGYNIKGNIVHIK